MIPRKIFENTVAGLAGEFRQIDRVVGFFSEAVLGKREPAILAQISTTDPSILVSAAPKVILAIAATIKFMVGVWKQVEHIRKVREETRGLNIANDHALKSFDDHLKKVVDEAIEKQVQTIIPNGKAGREKELENGLRWSIEHLMSRVERGMTIEIKLLPPTEAVQEASEAEKAQSSGQAKIFENLAEVQSDLMFHGVTVGEPMLRLEGPASDGTTEPEKKKPRIKKGTTKPS